MPYMRIGAPYELLRTCLSYHIDNSHSHPFVLRECYGFLKLNDFVIYLRYNKCGFHSNMPKHFFFFFYMSTQERREERRRIEHFVACCAKICTSA
jgi:hypothetical protein